MERSIVTRIALAVCALLASAAAQNCRITPSAPVGANSGASIQFSADCGTGLQWSATQGTVDPGGLYHAPPSVLAHNQDRGCQVSPNNSPFNIPVDQLPVDSHSAVWLKRALQLRPDLLASYHGLKFYPQTLGMYSNVVTNTTPRQTMQFYYNGNSNGHQGDSFPIPSERTMLMETGRSKVPFGTSDRHLMTINPDTCEATEIYNLYVDFRTVTFAPGNPTRVSFTTNTNWPIPANYQVAISGGTGLWAGANKTLLMTPTGANSGTLPLDSSTWGPPTGALKMFSGNGQIQCPTCNSQSGQKFRPDSYAQLGGVDAALMPIGATSIKLEEWYAATRSGRTDLGHALRTTVTNWWLSARYTWPAAGYALGRDILSAATNEPGPAFTAMFDIDVQYYHPCDNYTWAAGCHFPIAVMGCTGAWAGINGDQDAVAIDNLHFRIPAVNSTGMGPLTSATGCTFVPDRFPYGATLRLKASFNVDAICSSTDLNTPCPYAKVILNTIKKHGLIIADGTSPSDDWNSGLIHSEFHPKVLTDASTMIRGWSAMQPIEQYLEVVDRSSQKLSSDLNWYQQTNVGRTQVCVSGSAGRACTDILLQGTTIGTSHERLTIAAGVSYQLPVWVRGNADARLNYAIDAGIAGATVSSTGLLTMPACAVKQRGMVTVSHATDLNALPLYIEVTCLPKSADGSYRLTPGNYTGDYTDAAGNKWYGGWGDGGFNNWYEVPGLLFGTPMGTWQGYNPCANDTWTGTDSQLHSRSANSNYGFGGNDLAFEVVLPNGNYTVKLYGEPGFGGYGTNQTCGNTAGQDLFDLVIQGSTVASWQDGYVLAGNQPYRGWNLSFPANVADNVLDVMMRQRAASGPGVNLSSVLITPAGGEPPSVTCNVRNGVAGVQYSGNCSATGGVQPYTFSAQ